MTKLFGKTALLAATGLAAAAMLPAAASAAETFTFTANTTSTTGPAGNVVTFTGSQGTTLEVTAYSVYTSNGNSVLNQAYVGQYGSNGLGVTDAAENGSSPNHTVDDSGRTDILVFQFSKSVDVSSLTFTSFGDTDATVTAGSTNVPISGTFTLSDWNALITAFGATSTWQASPGNGSSGSRSVNGANETGNLFFVEAGNYPNSSAGTDDYFKIAGLSETPAVPEPATWGMMIGGLAAVGVSMRRRKTAVSFA